ncbi:FimV/HubP family polar landmark protein [Rheinheimera metallidurans]|uniref:FimV/HubP family polar landmark protein n=1 Tax=Rheinheimera metallidurans TaxID=2925781 RepID=UPI003001A1E5
MRLLISSLAFITTLTHAAPQPLAPVQPADTLWKLATQARPDEQVAMVQVVYALWQANPDAFTDANINALRLGSQLTVPERSQMLAISEAKARQWYHQAIAAKPSRSGKTLAKVNSDTVKKPEAAAITPALAHEQTTATAATSSTKPQTESLANKIYPISPVLNTPETIPAPEHWLSALNQAYTLSLEQRFYPTSGEQGQRNTNSSVALSAEWVWQSNDRTHQLALEPFLRWDQTDNKRNLIDVRQAYWQYAGDGFDVKAGVDIVFWGVTESQHLVDVINQTDLVATIDGETKLGQPMLNWNLYGDAGTLSFYLLPYFRERTLAGVDGRLRPPLPFATEHTEYESAQAEKNLDFALRWSRQFDELDIALSYFEGNNREPLFTPTAQGQLQPLYLQMQQLGLETQLISGSWIWKLEAIYRKTRQQDFIASTLGFEYTQVGLFESSWDVGWIAEYQYDSRNTLSPVLGQNDLFLGARLAANDAAGSEILLGLVQDLDNSDSRSAKIEAAMRLTSNLRLRFDAWLFQSQQPTEALYFIRHDDYLQLSIDYYF